MATLSRVAGVEDVSVSINEIIGEGPTYHCMVWGDRLDEAALSRALCQDFAQLDAGDIHLETMGGTVESTLGKRLACQVINIELLDAEDEAEIQRQFMEQLAAQGFEGHVETTFEMQDDLKIIRLDLSSE